MWYPRWLAETPFTRGAWGNSNPHICREPIGPRFESNGQSFEIAQHAIPTNQARVPTVAEVIQEHINLLIRPSSGITRTYQVMLDLHVRDVIGHIPVVPAEACSRTTRKGFHSLVFSTRNTW
jgi:DNA replicative helicase MCM subunit Mcm2 (Cdc46/Mcm family)